MGAVTDGFGPPLIVLGTAMAVPNGSDPRGFPRDSYDRHHDGPLPLTGLCGGRRLADASPLQRVVLLSTYRARPDHDRIDGTTWALLAVAVALYLVAGWVAP